MNRLYFGDNLKWLSDKKDFPDTSVDLAYLDHHLTRTPIAQRAQKSCDQAAINDHKFDYSFIIREKHC